MGFSRFRCRDGQIAVFSFSDSAYVFVVRDRHVMSLGTALGTGSDEIARMMVNSCVAKSRAEQSNMAIIGL